MKITIVLIGLLSTVAFADSPFLDGVSKKCKSTTDCIVAYDQCGRCYAVNRSEKEHVESILFRSCPKPADEAKHECKYTEKNPAKCVKGRCQ